MKKPKMVNAVKQTVMTKFKASGEESSESADRIVGMAETDGHSTSIGMGLVMSGEYQSVSLNCTTTVPCMQGNVKKAQQKAAELTEEFLAAQVASMKGTLRKLIREARKNKS